MKVCPQCGETYAEFVDFCFADGTVLALEAAAPVPDEPDAFDAPPPPKMLQGSQQKASYTRSATPVPRARRPGRSLLGTGEAAYSPPQNVEAPRTPTPAPAPIASPPQPEQMFGDAPEELEGAAPEEDALEGDVESTWGDDDDGFFEARPQHRTPTPPPAGDRPVEVSMSKAELEAWKDEEEDEDRAGGIGVFALAGAGFLAVVVVAVVFLFTLSTIIMPDDGDEPTEAPDPTPVQPVEPEPAEPAPVVDPQPEAIDPVQPEATDVPVEPEATDVPVEPDATDAPVVPEPAEPAPVAPAQPAPRPDPVAAVRPSPRGAPVAVAFTSTPSGSMIYVDGNAIGTTRFMRELPSGQHRIRIEKDGYEPFERLVSVAKGMAPIDATLKPVGGVAPAPAQPAPGPAPAAPAPAASEMLNTLFFLTTAKPANVATVRVLYRGNRIGVNSTERVMFPVDGAKVTFEIVGTDGSTWTREAWCGSPMRASDTAVGTIQTGKHCPSLDLTGP